MRKIHHDHRKRLAMGGLLLASFLEVCGCNPPNGHEQFCSTHIFFARSDLRERCLECVSTTDLQSLEMEQRHSDDAGVPSALESGRTLPDALRSEPGFSFYSPPEVATEDALSREPMTLADISMAERKSPALPIAESVFFVYKVQPTSRASERRLPAATAFVLSVPDRAHRRFIRFLVTARHIVDPQWAHCAENNPQAIDIRLNKRTGGIGFERIRLEDGRVPLFYTPADGTSDLALILLDQLLIPDIEAYKFIDVPFRLLPTDDELRSVRTDQQVTTAGVFTQEPIETTAYPVAHPGLLSKMPAGTVNVQCGSNPNSGLFAKQLHIWFIAATVPQGVSGAPVYTAMVRDAGDTATMVLLGVQSVAWPDKGIAGITPSAVLSDLIRTTLSRNKLDMDFYKGAHR